MRFYLFLTLLLYFVAERFGIAENITEHTNGCKLITSDEVDLLRDHLDMPHPFLNCSHLGKTSFDLSGVSKDIASISFAYNEMTSFDVDDLANFTKVKKIDLRHNKIPSFASVNSTYDSVQSLYLSHNKLQSIPNGLLKSFPKLYALDVSGNGITAIQDDDFKYNTKFTMLVLGSNPLKQISKVAMQNLATLHVLSLQFANLREVPSFVSNMSKLVFLTLTNNEISNVQRNTFYGAKALRWLELASNKIVRLDRLAFAGANSLRYLDLTDNNIQTLPPGVFNPLHDEEQVVVEMYENPLRCNCSLKWLKLWADSLSVSDVRYKCIQPKRNHEKKSYELEASDFSCDPADEDWKETCDHPSEPEKPATKPDSGQTHPESTLCPKVCKCFDSNGTQYYPKDTSTSSSSRNPRRRLWFLGDVQFPHVDCSDAQLETIPTASIRTDIKALTLEGNKLGTFAIEDLKRYPSLTTLNLEDCGLRTIQPSSSVFLANLTTLFLHRNKLTSLTQDHLRSFPNLKMLRVFNNKITNFPPNTFSSNRKLNRLYIGSNPVKKFDSRCLNGLDLYSLSLRNMSLQTVPVIKSENLTYLELSDNNITVIPNNTFRWTPTLFRLTIDNNRLSTIQPSAFNQTSKLRYLDLSENKLTKLPRGVFDSLDSDGLHIELWMNRMFCDCNLRWLKQWIDGLEAEDPMTEIRFMCFRPWRIHGKISDKLHVSDFTCDKNDDVPTPNRDRNTVEDEYYVHEHGMCYTRGQMALGVILSILFTCLILLAARWCLARRRKRYSRYTAHDDGAQLDMNM